MTTRRFSDAEYAAMAKDYEDNPITADEVLSVEVVMGRPRAEEKRKGKTPTMSVRLPSGLREAVKRRADAAFGGNEGDVIRAAVQRYLVEAEWMTDDQAPAKKAPAKKAPAKKAPPKKTLAKQAPVKKQVAKRAPAKKAPAKKTIRQ